jgi:hypothetical protein
MQVKNISFGKINCLYFAKLDIFSIFAAVYNSIDMAKIIGRESEQRTLQAMCESGTAEFAIVYGRRRVGKTFLIREFFKNDFAFYHTGLNPKELPESGRMQAQLENFGSTLSRYGSDMKQTPKSWLQAFDMLITLLDSKPKDKRMVVFLDEMPWMDTARSMFLSAFEHFWNGWGAGQDNLILIACGSATSWMCDELKNNTKGLYGRITRDMPLEPFNLYECDKYFDSREMVMDGYDLIQTYMATGGVPYYLSCFEKGYTVAQNIDRTYFAKNAPLGDEFSRLFTSVFINSENCEKTVRFLATRRYGYSREEISNGTKISTGSGLTKTLRGLVDCNLITSYKDILERQTYYKLTDAFCLFYLRFVDGKKTNNRTFWQNNQFSSAVNAWHGLAFEDLCFNHIPQIRRALGISGVSTEISTTLWRASDNIGGSQIDMVISRADRHVHLCELKFSVNDVEIDKDYDAKLRDRLVNFQKIIGNRRIPEITLITTYGLKHNMYSGRIQQVVTMDDLIEKK